MSRVVRNSSSEDDEGDGTLADLRNHRLTSRILMSKVYRSISDSSWAHSPVNTQVIGLHSFFPMLFYSKYIQNIIMSRQVCRWGFPKPRLLPTILGWPLVLKTAVNKFNEKTPPALSAEWSRNAMTLR